MIPDNLEQKIGFFQSIDHDKISYYIIETEKSIFSQ